MRPPGKENGETLKQDPASKAPRLHRGLDFGVAMHIAWTRHLLDNREFIVGGGTQPNTEPSREEGLDGSATAEERDNYHRDAYRGGSSVKTVL